MEAIRRLGISVYNQQVFTVENSRKFETVALRYVLKEIWVDPYYNFNAKGKEETVAYRVPIYEYLKTLKRRGEDRKEHENIWYYF